MLAVLIIHLPVLPVADPYAPETMNQWSRSARTALKKEATSYLWSAATPAHLAFIRQLPDEAPGKQQYVEFLKEAYGYNIDRLNAAYGLSASSFTDLYSFDYRALDLTRPAVRADDAAFLASVNEILLAQASRVTGKPVHLASQ